MNTSFLLADRNSAFRMRRPVLSNGNFVTDIDRDVDEQLKVLDGLLGKPVLPPPRKSEDKGSKAAKHRTKSAAVSAAEAACDPEEEASAAHETGMIALLKRTLSPWRPTDVDSKGDWADGSLAEYLSSASAPKNGHSIRDHIERIPKLSALRYDVSAQIAKSRFALEANARAILEGRPNIEDYLIARAYYIGGRRDPSALYNYVVSHANGVASIVDYAAISAGRAIIHRKRLKVPNYRKDNSAFANALRRDPISLSSAGFQKALTAVANDLMFNESANDLIDFAAIGDIPEDLRPKLVRYIKTSRIPITRKNIGQFLPSFVTRAYGMDDGDLVDEPGPADDSSYLVQFQDRAESGADVDRDAIHYAAQLFHGMVLGEELGVFDAFQYLLHSRMLVGGGMQVRDKALREDLRLYTLSNEYRDLGRPGHPREERTRASERKMFARQVFAQGEGQLIEGMQENREFRQLWQVLMLESARYLERAQDAYNPESFVSKQNVMQAIEDLQYNLSTYCVGWPQVMAPAIDAELNYVLTRFIGNEKIAQQVLPAGGSWKRIIDKLNTERPKKRNVPAAALLYSKAWQGMEIINSIAEYTPAAYENNDAFSRFISLVDAYITTESKLQRRPRVPRAEDAPYGESEEDDNDDAARNLAPGAQRETAPATADDEWDF